VSLRHARNASLCRLLVYWSHLSRCDIPAHLSLAARNAFSPRRTLPRFANLPPSIGAVPRIKRPQSRSPRSRPSFSSALRLLICKQTSFLSVCTSRDIVAPCKRREPLKFERATCFGTIHSFPVSCGGGTRDSNRGFRSVYLLKYLFLCYNFFARFPLVFRGYRRISQVSAQLLSKEK